MRHSDMGAYLRFANDCLEEANRERDATNRGLLVVIADACMKLADRAEALSTVDAEEDAMKAVFH
jgi:hypothetical protein